MNILRSQIISIVLLLFISEAKAQQEAVCNVCGAVGMQVGSPETILDLSDQQLKQFEDSGINSSTCGELETVGASNLIPVKQCTLLPELIKDICNCKNEATPSLAATATINGEDEEGRDLSMALYLIIASVVGVALLVCCWLCCQCTRKGGLGPVGSSNFTPALMLSAGGSGDNPTPRRDPATEQEQEERFEQDAKLRPLVLDALFPEQKCSDAMTEATSSSSGDDSGGDDDQEAQAPPCSICLESLDENESVVFGSSCLHVYHRECILEWLNKPMKKQKQFHDDCPNCRQGMWDADTYELLRADIARREKRKAKSADEQV